MSDSPPAPDRVCFRFPRPVASKKNRRAARKRGKHHFTVPSDEAQADERALAQRAALAASAQGWRLEEEQDLALEARFHVPSGELEILVRRLRPCPRGVTGRRRDLHGMVETIADALQGVLYGNDNQIALVILERVYEGGTDGDADRGGANAGAARSRAARRKRAARLRVRDGAAHLGRSADLRAAERGQADDPGQRPQ